jgi:hypothetical protein
MEHKDLIRGNQWESKNLPEKVRKHSVMLPTSLIHSNLFMLSTRNKEWLLDDFPIQSRFLPKEYSLSYTGPGLNSFDLEIMIAVVKSLEARGELNEEHFPEYAHKLLEKDKRYQALMNEEEKEEYRKEKIKNLSMMEGVFLDMTEFLSVAGLSRGGKSVENVKEALSKLSRGTLTVRTNFEDSSEDFEITERLIHTVYMNKREAFYTTISPMMFDFFKLNTSLVNTKVYRSLDSRDKARKKINANLYPLLMAYAREGVRTISIREMLIKSPYYLLKQRSLGNIKLGKLAYTLPDGKLDEKGISHKQLDKYISHNRRDILEFFKRLDDLNIIKSQIEGRGDNIEISFMIPKRLERIALELIEQEQLRLSFENSEKKED